MKLLIAGGRSFNDYERIKKVCDKALPKFENVEIVSGTANGADKLGELYAKENGYPIKYFPAEWDKYGKSAGYKRNEQMAEYADAVIVFWDGESKGTKHMIDIAQRLQKPIKIYKYGDR